MKTESVQPIEKLSMSTKEHSLNISREEQYFYSSPFERGISSTKLDTGLIKIHVIYGDWCCWCESSDHSYKLNCNSTKRDLSAVGFCCSIYLHHESTNIKVNDAC